MWQPDPPDFVRIADALYDARPSENEWLARTLAAVTSDLPGAMASLVAIARAERGRIVAGRGWAADATIVELANDAVQRQSTHYLQRRSRHLVVTDQQLEGADLDHLAHGPLLKRLGAADLFGLGGPEPDGSLVAISVAIPKAAAAWPEALVEAWEAVALHLGAAVRFRDAISGGQANAEAVFSTDGKLLDAFGHAQGQRAQLRQVVQRVQRSRGRFRDKPDALAARTPSIDARWTLVDQFDSDGRHFLVAYVVDEDRPGSPLSQQERRVAEHLAAGWSMKRIAYRLGLTQGTIASYARRACQKLGVRGRIGLARELSRS